MKGVILAGGLGSRLHPLTKITNKHLLPVYDKPMIYYSIELLVEAGIKDIMIVTGGNCAGDFLKLLGNGNEFGLTHINYAYQEGEGGIAQALGLTRHFVDKDKVVVVLGDNILEKGIKKNIENFEKQESGARILLKEVHDPKRFGVPEIKDGKIINIEEKPKNPKTNYAVIGVYCFSGEVFDYVDKLKPSDRGELEIADVINFYIKNKKIQYDILDGWWTDAGTFDSLLRATNLIAGKEVIKQ